MSSSKLFERILWFSLIKPLLSKIGIGFFYKKRGVFWTPEFESTLLEEKIIFLLV